MNAIKVSQDPTTKRVTLTPMQLNPKMWFADVQTLCEGYIQRAWVRKGERTKNRNAVLELWANEDGISLELPPTVSLRDPLHGDSDPLFGTMVIVAMGKEYGLPRDMTEKEKESILLMDFGITYPWRDEAGNRIWWNVSSLQMGID